MLSACILAVAAGLLLLLVLLVPARESYMNYPQLPMIDPSADDSKAVNPAKAATAASQKAAEANVNYRSLLKYVQENPASAFTFLADLKSKFFDESCQLKQPRIDFASLEADYRPVF